MSYKLRDQRFAVYRNIHKDAWSLQATKPKRRVIAHPLLVLLKDVKFSVGPAGRARVIREGRKNVHARAYGTMVGVNFGALSFNTRPGSRKKRQVAYNPYNNATFVFVDDGSPCHTAAFALFDGRGKVWVIGGEA